MTAKTSAEVIARARMLRVDARMSLDEIAAETGTAKGTLYPFLKDLPLTDEERLARRVAGYEKSRQRLAEIAGAKRGTVSRFYSTIGARAKTTDQKGAIAEAAAIFRMKVWGFVPHVPLCAGGKSDVAVSVPDTGRLLRVQVKCVRRPKWGMPVASLNSRANGKMGVRYAADAFDFFVGYDLREDVCYVYSALELVERRSSKTMATADAERWDKLIAA